MTSVEFNAENPGGIDMSYGFVKVELDTGTPGPGHYSGGEIAGVHKFYLDEDGAGSINLVGNDLITPEGSVWRIDVEGYKVALSVPSTGGPYSWADPALITTQNPPVTVEPGTTQYVTAWIDPRDYGAANDGATDDSDALQEAIDAAVAGGIPLVLTGEYSHADTLTYVGGGMLTVFAHSATITYTGTDWQWDLDVDSGAAGLPYPAFHGGTYYRSDTAAGGFNMHDIRNALFVDVEVECEDNTGTAWHLENEGRWTERNSLINCSARNYQHALHLDLHEVGITHKATASLVATLTVPGHRFTVGDRVQVVLDTPDADYDTSNAVVTAVTSSTVSYATTGGDETITAATGTMYAKGSFARTYVQNLKLQGGVTDEAAIEMHLLSGPYDSYFDVRGNVAGGAIVFGLTNGAMGGTVLDAVGVEVQSSGTVYLIREAPAPTGRRPTFRGDPRLTSNEYDPGGVALYYGTPPAESPFYPWTVYGGIETPDYVEADLGVVLRISSTHPVLGDWPTNPPMGTILLRDNNDGATGIYELAVRTNNNIRTAALRSKRSTEGTAAPSSGTWARGDICWNTSPSSGQPPFWMCTSAGTPGTWSAAANLA